MGRCRGRRFFQHRAARCRRRGVNDPIYTTLVEGSCHITPSQDHTPPLACEVVMKSMGSPTKLSVRQQQPPQGSAHGVAETWMSSGSDVGTKSQARDGVFCFRKRRDQLVDHREIPSFAVSEVFQTHT